MSDLDRTEKGIAEEIAIFLRVYADGSWTAESEDVQALAQRVVYLARKYLHNLPRDERMDAIGMVPCIHSYPCDCRPYGEVKQ